MKITRKIFWNIVLMIVLLVVIANGFAFQNGLIKTDIVEVIITCFIEAMILSTLAFLTEKKLVNQEAP